MKANSSLSSFENVSIIFSHRVFLPFSLAPVLLRASSMHPTARGWVYSGEVATHMPDRKESLLPKSQIARGETCVKFRNA
jgi:hypothetical protein